MSLVNIIKISGLSDQVQSWLFIDSNQAVQDADMTQVFSQERIVQITSTSGVVHHQAVSS